MSESVFEKIARRELPAYIVWEDDLFMAFLTIAPFAKGHTLVIPKENWGDYIFDLSDEQLEKLMLAAKKVAVFLKEKLKSERVLVWVEGYEVPHVHVHLIPSHRGQGVRGSQVQEYTTEQYAEIMKELGR